MTEKKIDEILRSNMIRFMEEAELSREEVVRRYNEISGKKIGPSWISQLRSGKPIGKNAIKILARVFHKEVWEFYVPHGAAGKYAATNPLPAGRMIPVIPLSLAPAIRFRGKRAMIDREKTEMALSVSMDENAFFIHCDLPDCLEPGKCMLGDYLLVEPNKSPMDGSYVLVRYQNMISVREFQIVRRGKNDEIILRPVCPLDRQPAIFVTGKDNGDLVYFPITQIIRNLEKTPPRESIPL